MLFFHVFPPFLASLLFPAGLLGASVVPDSQGASPGGSAATTAPSQSPIKSGTTASSVPVASSSAPVPRAIQLLTSGSDELAREVLPAVFNYTVPAATAPATTNVGTAKLEDHSTIKTLMDNFRSVELLGDFAVQVAAEPAADTTTAWSVQARVAIVPENFKTPANIMDLARVPGNVLVTYHNLGGTQGVLRFPPGVARNLKWPSQFEKKPKVICMWTGAGVKNVTVILECTVAPSGLDLWAFAK